MDNAERRRKLKAVLDHYDAMAARFQESRDAYRASSTHVQATSRRGEAAIAYVQAAAEEMRAIGDEIRAITARERDMNQAANEAGAAMMAANRAIQELFADDESEATS